MNPNEPVSPVTHNPAEDAFYEKAEKLKNLSSEEIFAEINKQLWDFDAEFKSLVAERDQLKVSVAEMEKALNRIASWDEGVEVTGSFDEPCSAKIAREALQKQKSETDNPDAVTAKMESFHLGATGWEDGK